MALTDLDAVSGGFIQYGKFKFPDAVTKTMACRISPQFDAGKRTVTHSVYQITLRTYLDGNPTDAAVTAAVAELQRAGSPFRYTGHGCGSLRINVGGAAAKDVLWGPIPGDLTIRPVGSRRACELTWTVSVSVPTCDDAVYLFSPLEFSYTMSFELGRNRLTTRRYSATLRIPNNRMPVGGRLMLDSPDAYREEIAPPLPAGFYRDTDRYEIDESKTRLTATVVDVEWGPNTLPPGVIVGTAAHAYHSYPGKMGTMWSATVEAEFEVPKPADIGFAVRGFLALARDRVDPARDMRLGEGIPAGGFLAAAGAALAGAAGLAPGLPEGKVTIIPHAFSVAEPRIFGPHGLAGRFSMTYTVAGTGLEAVLRTGGLWRRSGDWRTWFAPVAGVMGPRGVAGMRLNANEDALVDLCGRAEPVVPVAPPPRAVPGLPDVIGAAGGAVGRGALVPAFLAAFPPPGPGDGWLDLRVAVGVEEDHGVVVGRALPPEPLKGLDAAPGGLWDILKRGRPPAGDPGVPFPPAADYQVPNQSPSRRGGASQAQRRVEPAVYLWLRGYALRWARPIPCPTATDASGDPLTNCNRLDRGEGFWQAIVGHALYPVYYAEWCLRFHASGAMLSPGSFPVIPNAID